MKKVLFPILVLLLALGLALPGAMPAVADPDPGLVGLWHLDEGSGQTAVDATGVNDGQLGSTSGVDANDPTWEISGKFGNALSFDGVNDYVDCGTGIAITTAITVETWIKPSAFTNYDAIVANFVWPTNPEGFSFRVMANGKLVWRAVLSGNNAYSITSNAALETGNWYHVAVTHNSSYTRLYINGTLDKEETPGGTIINLGKALKIGWDDYAADRVFDGTIDEVRIWDEALTAEVIAEHAAAEMVLEKDMPEEADLGDIFTVTLDVENPYTHDLTVEDVIPDGLRYILGTFEVDGDPVLPTVADSTISTTVGTGTYTITFDVQVVEVQCTDVTVRNTAELSYDSIVVASDSEDITLHPYDGFEKTVEIVYEDGDWDGIVEVNELVTWNMTITVPNNFDWPITGAVLSDNLGGELGLAGDNVDNNRVGGKDEGVNGDLAPEYNTMTNGTLSVKTPGKSNKVHFWIKNINVGAGDSWTCTLGIFTDRNPSKWGQQCYTSPCLHYLNSGATLKFTDPVTDFQLSAHTCPLPVYVTDAMLTLENKDSEWQIIEDDISGELYYSTEGDVFCYEFRGYVPENIEYSLIYYADKLDRFLPGNWGGDNPGALIGTGTASGGTLTMSGSVELNMDLPHPSDANSYYYNYSDPGDPHYTGDGYATAYGAKIWLVPSVYYDATAKKVTSWQPTSFLFETDLISYDDTDVP